MTRLIPELDVSDLDRSLAFYVNVVGFRVLYDRPEERFAFLDLDGARLMLEEAAGPGRCFQSAPLERPFGRGVNFQIEAANVDALHERVREAGFEIVIPIEERWYRRDQMEFGKSPIRRRRPRRLSAEVLFRLGTAASVERNDISGVAWRASYRRLEFSPRRTGFRTRAARRRRRALQFCSTTTGAPTGTRL